ncbi:MAG: hypothetical protein NVSMB7_12640 [Chitinophagaceae bacterium]
MKQTTEAALRLADTTLTVIESVPPLQATPHYTPVISLYSPPSNKPYNRTGIDFSVAGNTAAWDAEWFESYE